jgi:hypothetical protein
LARILILGDTWGISPCHVWPQNQLADPTQWFEFELMRRGHTVMNRSWGGNQNNYQLSICETHLAALKDHPEYQPDTVIWFHTELMRDMIPPVTEPMKRQEITLDQGLDLVAEEIYGRVARTRALYPAVKWAIIGGHAPVRQNRVHILEQAGVEYIKMNWRAEIAGVDIPESHAFEFLERWKGNLWDYGISEERIEEEQRIAEIIAQATADHTKFYNGKHPNWPAYHRLIDELTAHFGW